MRFRWHAALALFSGAIFVCFLVSAIKGVDWAVYLLPASGLFMSVIYPTINSKGISCLPKAEHGAGAGVLLFFTCVSAVAAPLAMGAVSDVMGQIAYGFWLATGLAGLLFIGLLANLVLDPTKHVFQPLDVLTPSRTGRA
jgi:fucose permease